MIYDTISNLELNIKYLLDEIFLLDGHYKNVTLNKTIRGVDVSKLVLDNKASSDILGVSGCQVWQSPYKQWVYESGIVPNVAPFISGLAAPIRCSGIYINGTYFASSVSGQQFVIDYKNGRVVFLGSGVPSNSSVKAQYAYKIYYIDFYDNEIQEEIDVFDETETKDNPLVNGTIIYPSGDNLTSVLPAIFLDIDGPTAMEPMELGNRSARERYDVVCYIYSMNRRQRNAAKELIKQRYNLYMPLVDFNYAPFPTSGKYHTLSSNYIPYQTLLTNPTFNGSKVISQTWYVEDITAVNLVPDGDPFMKAVATISIIIDNVAPTGRIPNNPYVG